MDDSEILSFIEQHVTNIRMLVTEEIEITWLDDFTYERVTKGENIRDAVIKAKLIGE